jgi:hypothetical protein
MAVHAYVTLHWLRGIQKPMAFDRSEGRSMALRGLPTSVNFLSPVPYPGFPRSNDFATEDTS